MFLLLLLVFALIASPASAQVSWQGVSLTGADLAAVTTTTTTSSTTTTTLQMVLSISADSDNIGIENSTPTCAGNNTFKSGETSNIAYVGCYAGTNRYSHMFRFVLTSNISNGATIDSAILSLYHDTTAPYAWDLGSDTLRFVGDNSGNTSTCTCNTTCSNNCYIAPNCQNGPTLTNQTVDWTPSSWPNNSTINSPELKAIIQEILDDNSGLSSGNGITLWAYGTNCQDEELTYVDDSHATLDPPKLTIAWH